MSEKYDDIINLPHHVSKKRPQMPMHDRAAQFASFAALTGYDSAIRETARLTDTRIELNEYEQNLLDEKLRLIIENLKDEPRISITFFLPDKKKAGGEYVTVIGVAKKVDEYEHHIIMSDGKIISIEEIVAIESNIFSEMV